MHVQIRMRLNNDILFLLFTCMYIFLIDMGELQKQIALNGGLLFVSVEKQHGESCEVTEV